MFSRFKRRLTARAEVRQHFSLVLRLSATCKKLRHIIKTPLLLIGIIEFVWSGRPTSDNLEIIGALC